MIRSSFLLLCLCGTLQAQIYVDADATGANDGTSWTDAYTTLEAALADAGEEVWIATGVYIPGAGTDDYEAAFQVATNKQLYGGFAGTETSLDQRDPTTNPTVLSADAAQDDVDGDFSTNRNDNRRHVMVVTVLDTLPDDNFEANLVFDGLIYEGGNTEDDGDLDFDLVAGGGLLCPTTATVNNCTFRNNFAVRGGGMTLYFNAHESTVTNCTFQQNRTSSQAAGLHVRNANDVTIDGCAFLDNQTVRGALYPLRCENFTISNCTFSGNTHTSATGFGGALFNWQSPGLVLSGCTFTENTAGNGGCMYSDFREFDNPEPDIFVIENCSFTDNAADDFGGAAFYFWNNSFTMTNCSFSGSNSAGSAAAIYIGGDNDRAVIDQCSFTGGSANFGSAIAHYAEGTVLTLTNTEFTQNIVGTSGTVTVGFKAIANLDNCSFVENGGNFGGAIYLQNDTSEITIRNSEFRQNITNNTASVHIAADVATLIDGNRFSENSSDNGGALSLFGSEGSDNEPATVSNNFFETNIADLQGGGINIQDRDANVFSNVFYANQVGTGGGGYGAAVMVNGVSAENPTVVNLTNNTFYSNFGDASTIGGFVENDSAEVFINLQNNIFAESLAPDYAIEAGNPQLVSGGGNVSDNESLGIFANDTALDVLESENIELQDPEAGNYRLAAGSAGIGIGVASGAPQTDIEGNVRVETIDAGAYESPFADPEPIATDELVVNTGQLQLDPNPTPGSTVRLTFETDYLGAVEVRLMDGSGRLLRAEQHRKGTEQLTLPLDVSALSAGYYVVWLRYGDAVLRQPLVVR